MPTGTLPCLLLLFLLTELSLDGAGQFERVLQPGWTNQNCYSWAASWGDYSGDGYPDLHISNATLNWGPYVNFVYRNNGANTNAGPFTQMTTNELGDVVGNVAISFGATWIDANNDGRLDLAVVRAPKDASSAPVASRLYLNQGSGKLVSVTAGAWTLPTFAFDGTWGDYDNDGWLDFHELSAWVTDPANWPNIPTNRLFRGRTDLRFEEIRNTVISTTEAQAPNNSAWSDYDNDGDLDLLVVNMGESVSFFQNQGRGDFVPLTNAVTARQDGYNSAWGDYDNDGDLDLVIVGSAKDLLYRNNYPDDFTILNLNEANGYPSWADYDNDGLMDLLITRGQSGPMRNSLLRNNGDGTFTSVTDAMTIPGRWLNGAWGDYDNDGAMDLFVTSATGANALFHNLGNTNHWIKFDLKGTVSNAAAIGAKVRVKATIRGQTVWQMREVQSGAAGRAQHDLRPNFGLGDATKVDLVRIEWPSGNVQEIPSGGVSVDQVCTFQEIATIRPSRPIASLGGSVTLTDLGGASYYQWRFNGDDLTGQTSRTLTLENLTTENAGGYSVVVTLSNGTIQTNYTFLTVDPTFTKITRGAVVEDREPSNIPAWGDFDDDGLVDLFVPNNGDYPNALYRNLGSDEFVRMTNALTLSTGRTWGAMCADVDNDGDLDVFINRPFSDEGYPNNFEYNEMFENQGGGVFTRLNNAVTSARGFWTDASFADLDRDGWLDVFLTTQRMATTQSLDDYFFHNLTDGTFAALTTNEVGIVLTPQSATAGPAWCDVDGDGDLDLYVSKYGGVTNFLYRNDNGRLVSVAAGSLPAKRSTWAAQWADFNNDGLFDLFTAGENGTNMLHLNRGNWEFEDATVASGLALAGNVFTVTIGDYDNDGDQDLYVDVYDAADVFYVNRGDGTFDRVNVGSPLNEGTGDGAVWVDYNNDGFLDLFKSCGDLAPVRNLLYRNSLPQYGNTNHWLKLKLKGTTSNASAIGARAWVRANIGGKETWQVRQLTTGCLTPSPIDGMRLHFGLGDATNVTTLRIAWPSGIVQEILNVTPNQILTITEPRRPVLTIAVTGTGVEGSLRADPNSTYQLQMSGDLTTWTDQGTVTTDAQGVGSWSDAGMGTASHRFYRARSL